MSVVMRTIVAASFVVLAGSWVQAQHRLIVQGNEKLVIVGRDGKAEWQMPWGGIHDVHVLPNGNILVQQGAAKVVEIDRNRGEVVWTYDSAISNGNAGRPVEVHAFQPLDDQRVMIAESGPARIIEIDRAGRLLHSVTLKVDHPHPHTDTRLARKLANGHYLVCHEGDGAVREYDHEGGVVWDYSIGMFGKEAKPGHGPEAFGNKCFSAVRLPTGNTLDCHGKRPQRSGSHARKANRLATPPARFAGDRAGLGDNAGSAAQWPLRDRQLPRRARATAFDRAGPENKKSRLDLRPIRRLRQFGLQLPAS